MTPKAIVLIAALIASACSGSRSDSPTSPSVTTTMTGTWVGTASDSTGSMMGAGLTGHMGSTTWVVEAHSTD